MPVQDDDRHAGERNQHSEQPPWLGRAPRKERPVDQQHEDRHCGDHERGDARGNALLRPDHETVAHTRKQHAGQHCLTERHPGQGPRRPHPQPYIHQGRGDNETYPAGNKRRQGPDGERDTQIGRPPDHIDRDEGQCNLEFL